MGGKQPSELSTDGADTQAIRALASADTPLWQPPGRCVDQRRRFLDVAVRMFVTSLGAAANVGPTRKVVAIERKEAVPSAQRLMNIRNPNIEIRKLKLLQPHLASPSRIGFQGSRYLGLRIPNKTATDYTLDNSSEAVCSEIAFWRSASLWPTLIRKAALCLIRCEMSVRTFFEDHVSPLPWFVVD